MISTGSIMSEGLKRISDRFRAALPPALLMIVALLISGCARPGEADKATVGKTGGATATGASVPAPETISDIEQKLGGLRGKVVILDLWATWCGPCRIEIPAFIRLQEKYRDKGLEVVGVSLDPITRSGNAAVVGPFMQQYGINYTIWLLNNPNGFGKYPMGTGIPTTYIIDRDGRTAKVYVGAQSEALFENEIRALL
jgi:thiol-disulfide isomerase/thioredoxin